MTQKEDPYIAQLRKDVEKIAATPEGKNLFRYLAIDLCGYNLPSLAVGRNGEVSTLVMISRDSQRNVWLELMQYIPRPDLVEILLPAPLPVAPKDDTTPVTEDESWRTTHQTLQQTLEQQALETGEPLAEPPHRMTARGRRS